MDGYGKRRKRVWEFVREWHLFPFFLNLGWFGDEKYRDCFIFTDPDGIISLISFVIPSVIESLSLREKDATYLKIDISPIFSLGNNRF